MPLWICEWTDCKNPAAQNVGDCLLCDRHLCREHRQRPKHKCPTPEENWEAYSAGHVASEARYIKELCDRVDSSKLCSHASKLREGIPCSVDLSANRLSALMGNQNCHAEITFQDNVKWIARFRLTKTSSPPREVNDRVLRSEAATMIYLQQNTCIPVPKVFDWACESDPANVLGVSYILMEKVDGKPLEWQSADTEQREKVMQQLAKVYLEIAKHAFTAMGSLVHLTGDNIGVKGLADPTTFRIGEGPLGPFASSQEGWQALIESYLSLIADGEIDSHSPVATYLAHRSRLDLMGVFCSDDRSDDTFYIKHMDDKGDHILVNEEFDIVGIIDWEWARTVSKAEAFFSPCMMWPVGKFYDGSNELAAEELRFAEIFREQGREDLANCIVNGRRPQRFSFALGTDETYSDTKTFTQLFAGLQKAFDCDVEQWEIWKNKALERWKDDERLLRLLRWEIESAPSTTQ